MARPDLRLLQGLTPVRADEDIVNPGGPGDNGGMEARIRALETAVQGANDRLTRIETRLDHMPTKADLSDALHSQTRWVIGTAIALAAVAFAAAKLF